MTTAARLALIFLLLVVLLGAGLWYYLFGPNTVAASDLVPSDTVLFASVPNATPITFAYQMSQLKQLVDAPESKPLLETLQHWLGDKNMSLLTAFFPNLSGQSFVAVTHLDFNRLGSSGFVAGFRPKRGTADFDAWLGQLKAAYPGLAAQATEGDANVEGLEYHWTQGPGAADKICVARYRGWIVVAWGEASLRDWWERLEKKSATPSLTQNPDYQKSLTRVGADSEAVLYLNEHALLTGGPGPLAARNPFAAHFLATNGQAIGAFAVGAGFEHGEIVEHYSLLVPRPAQDALAVVAAPCAFETLKFTSPDTRFYWGGNVNWSQAWKNLQDQADDAAAANPGQQSWVTYAQSWAQDHHLDFQHDILALLGNEFSVQAEWSADTLYPEIGLFVKLDKPDDFKPAVAAFIDTIRQAYVTSAVIHEINSGGQNFATLKFVQPLPVSPTITEDGPYLGVFLTENQAVRSFQRDASVGLLNNPDFSRQIGARRETAAQLIYMDTPRFVDRAYQAVLPYLSLAAMLNRSLGAMLQNQNLPPNLMWLAPIGTWSFVLSSDDDGLKGYSVSGIGNQGFLLTKLMQVASPLLPPWVHFPSPPVAPPPAVPAPAPVPVLPPTTNAAPTSQTPPPADSASTNNAPTTPPSAPPTEPAPVITNSLPAPVAPTPTTDAAPLAPSPAQTH